MNFGQQGPRPIYAESTWTPTVSLAGGAGNTVPVYTTNTGRYTRIGNRVFCEIYLTGDGGAEGAGTGVVQISLPFNAGPNHPNGYFFAGYAKNNVTEYELIAQIAGGAPNIGLGYFNAIATTTPFTGADQNNSTRTISLKFFYDV